MDWVAVNSSLSQHVSMSDTISVFGALAFSLPHLKILFQTNYSKMQERPVFNNLLSAISLISLFFVLVESEFCVHFTDFVM